MHLSWHPEHGAFLVSSIFNFTLILFALYSWLHIKTEIHDMIYLQIFFISSFLLLFIIFFTFTPEQVNSLSNFLTASGTLYILNLFSLAPVHLPMDIVKPLFFFHLLLQGHFFSFKAFFLNLHMSVYSLVMQKLCPLQFGYFPTISDCQHLHWYLVYKSWERKKRVAPKIQKHSTTGLCL